MKFGLIACAAMALMGCAGQDDSGECLVPAKATYAITYGPTPAGCYDQVGGNVTLANGVQRSLDDRADQRVDADGCGISAKNEGGSYSIRFDQDWEHGTGVAVNGSCVFQVELVRQ